MQLKWKRDIINLITSIYAAGCPDTDPGFVGTVREIFMIYLNSINITDDNSGKWTSTLKPLNKCKDEMKQAALPVNMRQGSVAVVS
jgi:hypothetical protein